jgi:peptidyl serine alpha-galactosyltransferase
VSGCKDDAEEQTIRSIFNQQIKYSIPTGKNRFHIHVTPDFSRMVPNVEYKALNKPFGVLHWMENSLNMPDSLPQYSDSIFIIIDPDQVVIRPFTTHDFTNDFDATRWHNYHAESDELKNSIHILRDGHPVSQLYAMGADWINGVNTDVQRVIDSAWNATTDNPAFTTTMKTSSHLYNWTTSDVWRSYVAGPPYIATGLNMYQIAVVWAAVSVPVYELTTNPISEMYAYSTAAAHLYLPHDLAYNFMISNAGADYLEGWNTIDEMAPKDICQYTLSDANDPMNVQYRKQIPYVLHYCQEFFFGPYYFFKYYLSENFLSCEHPLMIEPSDHDKQILNSSDIPGASFLVQSYNTTSVRTSGNPTVSDTHRQRHAFMLCHLVARVNEAATFWKEQNCIEGMAKYDKVYTVAVP